MKPLKLSITLLMALPIFSNIGYLDETEMIIHITHSDVECIKFQIELAHMVDDLYVKYRKIDHKDYVDQIDLDDGMVNINDLYYQDGYAKILIYNSKDFNETLKVLYHAETHYLTNDFNEVYFKPFFIGSNNVKIYNLFESKLTWLNATNDIDIINYALDIEELFVLKISDIPLIDESRLILEIPSSIFDYYQYDEKERGYLFPISWDYESNYLKLNLKHNLHYLVSSYQIFPVDTNNTISSDKIILPKNYQSNKLSLRMELSFARTKLIFRMNVFFNKTLYESLKNSEIIDGKLNYYEKEVVAV